MIQLNNLCARAWAMAMGLGISMESSASIFCGSKICVSLSHVNENETAAKIELCVNSWGFFISWFVSYSFHLCHHVIDPPFRPKFRWSLIFVPNIADTCWDGFGFLDLCWQMLQLYLVPFSPSNPYHPGYVSISGYILKTAPLKSIPMKQNWFVHTEWETGVERGDRRGWNQRLIEPLLSRK